MSSRLNALRTSLALSAIVMTGEPAVYMATVIVAATCIFRLTHALPYGHALAAVGMPIELAVACWVIGTRLEWRACTQERLLTLTALALCVAAFAIVWNDLRRGRRRSLRNPREARPWTQVYRPKPVPTVIPTVPVLLLIFLPAMSLGAIWAHSGSIGSHLNVTAAVFSMWALLWQHRNTVARSNAFRQMEQLTAPLDELIRRAAAPCWSLLVYMGRWCVAGDRQWCP